LALKIVVIVREQGTEKRFRATLLFVRGWFTFFSRIWSENGDSYGVLR